MKRQLERTPARWAALAAGILVLAAGAARAQGIAADYPDDVAQPAQPASPEGGEATAPDEAAPEEPSPPPKAPKTNVPAFGDDAQPPGTYPGPAPVVLPSPEEAAQPAPAAEEGQGGEAKAAAAGSEADAEGGAGGATGPAPEAGKGEGTAIQLAAIIPTAPQPFKIYQIQAAYELHFNLFSDEYGPNDWLSYYMLRFDLNLTKFDQLSLRADLEQRYIADQGESGLWFGDLRLYYSRKFAIPIKGYQLPGKVSIYLTAPTSRQSQKRSYITRPTLSLTFAPSLGPLTLIVNGLFRYSFAKYAESGEKSSANERIATGYMLQLIWAATSWFAPSATWQYIWSRKYESREGVGQPWQATYYWEVALNFSLPMPEKAPAIDVSLAYAQGSNVMDEGVYRLYFSKRDQSELYLGLGLSY